MTCPLENRDWVLAGYISGRLAAQESEVFERHFFSCAECAADLELNQRVAWLVKSEPGLLAAEYRQPDAAAAPPAAALVRRTWRRSPALVWAAACSLVAVVVLGAYLIFPPGDPVRALNFDSRVPHPYEPPQTELRGAQAESPALHPLYHHFIEAMLAYRDRNYAHAIRLFSEHGEALADLKAAQAAEPPSLVWEYEFYWGLSHLSMAVTRRGDPAESVRRRHFAEAVAHLNQAMAQGESAGSRLRFFLGLALGLQGEPSRAVALLLEIGPEDPDYEQGQEWIRYWTNER